MERIKKYLLMTIAICSIFFAGTLAAFCEETGPSLSTLVTPQNVPFEHCTRIYPMASEKLFYMTIASINANRFETVEMQSKMGYILFNAVNKEFLASIVNVDNGKSMLKITPANNNYYFAPGIVSNIYKYIDMYGATPVTEVKPNSN